MGADRRLTAAAPRPPASVRRIPAARRPGAAAGAARLLLVAAVASWLSACGDDGDRRARPSTPPEPAAPRAADEGDSSTSSSPPSPSLPAADPAVDRPAPDDEAPPRTPGPLVVRLYGRVVAEEDGRPLPDATVAASGDAPVHHASDGSFHLDVPLPLPEDLRLSIGARDREDAVVMPSESRPSLVRSTSDVGLDLGPIALAPGRAVTLTAQDATGPVADAAVHVVPAGAPFPPRAPGTGHRAITRLDDPPRARTDADGRAVLGVGVGPARLVVRHPTRGLALVTVAEDSHEHVARLDAAHRLQVTLRCDAPDLLPDREVDLVVDLGGVRLVERVAVDTPRTLLLDRARAVALRIDARGFRGVTRTVAAGAGGDDGPAGGTRASDSSTTAVELTLEATAVAHAAVSARDPVTGAPIAITELRVGRARDDAPDRIDFVPDWSCVPEVDATGARVAAPTGRYDVLVRAEGRLETLARRVAVSGTRDAPSAVTIDLPPAPPVAGRVARDPDLSPVAGAAVLLRRTSRDLVDLPLLWRLAGTVGLVDGRRTGADGRFGFETSAWETLEVEVFAAGEVARTSRLARAGAAQLLLAVPAPIARGGRFEGELERGPFATTAYLLDPERAWRFRAPVGPDGAFAFADVPPGTYGLYVDRDDRALFHGRREGLDHALAREMHGSPRGVAVRVERDTTSLPSPPIEGWTPRPMTLVVDLPNEHGLESIAAVRADGRVAARRVTRADAVGLARVTLPPLAEGPLVLLGLDAAGAPRCMSAIDAIAPRQEVSLDPRPARVVLRRRGADDGDRGDAATVDHVVATCAALPPDLARAAGVTRWSPHLLEATDAGFAATLPAGRWVLELRDEEAEVVERFEVDARAGETFEETFDG